MVRTGREYKCGLERQPLDLGQQRRERQRPRLEAGVVRQRGGDRDQVRSIWAGECDVSLGNTYYMGEMLEDPEQAEWAVRTAITNYREADADAATTVGG